MNQPIRAYPMQQAPPEVGSKTPLLTLSPQMKKRLKPIPDNASLLQMTLAKKSNTMGDSPVKLRIKNVKNSLIDSEKKDSPGVKTEQEDRLTLNFNGGERSQPKPQNAAFSEHSSPLIKKNSPIDGSQRFFLKGSFSDETKLPSLKDGSPKRRLGTPGKVTGQSMQHSGDMQKISFSEILTLNRKGDNKEEIAKSRIAMQESSPKVKNLRGNQPLNQIKPPSGLVHGRSASNPAIMQKPQLSEADDQKAIIKYVVQKSQAGQNASKQTKTNQDSIFYCSNYSGYKNRYYLGVCDGHGTYGHFVSQIIKKILPPNLESYLKQHTNKSNGSCEELGPKEETQVLRSFAQAFQKTSKEINSCGVDVTFSGTTCVTVLVAGQHVWCANIGDSRAVLYFLRDGMWNIQPLSNDHKPDTPAEKRRILNAKGRVEPFYGQDGCPLGPPRVWLQHEQVPGLAMSRSFGDYVASTVGVVADPEVTYFKVEFQWGFLVVASDGVWEFLSNERVCELLQSQPYEGMTVHSLESIANLIIKESTKQWQLEDEVIDDISVVVGLIQRQ